VDDTVQGVMKSAERVVTAVLAPVTAPVAALAHCQGGSDVRLNAAWAGWHTALCLLTRRHVLGSFLPLWLVTGICFIGFASHRARELAVGPGRFVRHVTGCHLTQEARAQRAMYEVTGNICRAVPRGAAPAVQREEGGAGQTLLATSSTACGTPLFME